MDAYVFKYIIKWREEHKTPLHHRFFEEENRRLWRRRGVCWKMVYNEAIPTIQEVVWLCPIFEIK